MRWVLLFWFFSSWINKIGFLILCAFMNGDIVLYVFGVFYSVCFLVWNLKGVSVWLYVLFCVMVYVNKFGACASKFVVMNALYEWSLIVMCFGFVILCVMILFIVVCVLVMSCLMYVLFGFIFLFLSMMGNVGSSSIAYLRVSYINVFDGLILVKWYGELCSCDVVFFVLNFCG